MTDVVLDLVASCENRISMVEELVTGDQYLTATLEVSLGELADERARLEFKLRELLARNCSLRRKDFNELMAMTITESERKKERLDEERRLVRDELKGYLGEQRQLMVCLRQQLSDFVSEKGDKDALAATVASIKAAYQQQGQQVLASLRSFQLRLEAFHREQAEINRELERLVVRGESLRLEDLRQLEAAKAGQERKTGRELRRREVAGLLACFKEQRQPESRPAAGSKNQKGGMGIHGNRIRHEATN